MINLRRLRVKALKQLRDVDIWFPRRGAILVEGRNESGKSTLFEAVYFALYGAPLVGEETRPALDDLLPHDGASASAELWLAVGENELEIRRVLPVKEGKRGNQQARLIVRRPGAVTEEVNGAAAVNTRILRELSGLDGDALRNSCFMEQKALDRLESLSRGQREAAVSRLLGLERLRGVESRLKIETQELEAQVVRARAELELARLRRCAAEATAREHECAARVRAAEVRALVAERDRETLGLETRARRGAALEKERAELEARVARGSQIAGLLDALVHAEEAVTRARAHVERRAPVRVSLDDLRRLEEIDIPRIEARLAALEALEAELAAMSEAEAAIARLEAQTAAESEALHAAGALDEARAAHREAQAAAAQAAGRETLRRWVQLKEVERYANGDASGRAELQRQVDAQAALAHVAGNRATRLALATVLLALICGASLVIGFSYRVAWIAAAAAALVALALVAGAMRSRRLVAGARTGMSEAAARLRDLEARVAAARHLGSSLEDLPTVEASLDAAGIARPVSVEAARMELARAANDSASMDLEREWSAAERLARALVEHDAARRRLHELQGEPWNGAHGRDERGNSAISLEDARAEQARRAATLERQAQPLGTRPTTADVAAARGAAEAELRALRGRTEARASIVAELNAMEQQERDALDEAAGELRQLTLQARALDLAVEACMAESPGLKDVEDGARSLREALQRELQALDMAPARERLAGIRAERAILFAGAGGDATYAPVVERIARLLHEQGITALGDEPLADLAVLWPDLMRVDVSARDDLERDLAQARSEAHHLRASALEQARVRGLEAEALDERECAARLVEAERARRRHAMAHEMARDVQARIVRRVLPETQSYMCALLPELTAGRYRDAQLLAEEAGGPGADLRIRVWDHIAGRYVAKNLFSGGTRDQCSLALRLAFALATLPKELGAIPGFIFLDEPLSSFDRERSRALVHVLTRGTIAAQFAQVLLISHTSDFERDAFAYTIRMSDGRVVGSNLPSEREARTLWSAEAAVPEPAG